MGGTVSHWGNIVGIKTGKRKTLAGILPSCLNAPSGDSVHIVITNDHLTKHQSEQMGRIYRFLDLGVDIILVSMLPAECRIAY